jgi:hypothetical protein
MNRGLQHFHTTGEGPTGRGDSPCRRRHKSTLRIRRILDARFAALAWSVLFRLPASRSD